NPKSYPIQQTLAIALRKAGQTDEAMKAFERAVALAPTAAGNDSPHAQLAEIALEKKDRARAISELTALLNVDFENLSAAQHLAESYLKAGRRDDAKRQALAALEIAPTYARAQDLLLQLTDAGSRK